VRAAPGLTPASDVVPAKDSAALVRTISVTMVRASHERLRSVHARCPTGPQFHDLPIRVVETGGGYFEIVDGFKRFARWVDESRSAVPAVVETARATIEQKLLVLRANAPPRTTTPMDEARVIQSLLDEDGLGLAGIAQLLGRRKPWVVRRLALATKLAPGIRSKVEQGAIGPTLAYSLCAVGEKGQQDLVRAAERHALHQHEALALVSTFRVASSDAERARLLAEPLPTVRPDPKSTSLVGPLAARLEARLTQARDILVELASFQLPTEGLTDAGRRRLQAQHRSVLDLLQKTTQALQPVSEKENLNENTRSTEPQHTGKGRCGDQRRVVAGQYDEEKNRNSTVSPEDRERIIELRKHRYGMRAIALRLGRDRKTIRRILEEEGVLQQDLPRTNKLDPFHEIIRDKVGKRLTATTRPCRGERPAPPAHASMSSS
jgi:ParB-like chromosome segregation protein Spo0J